MLVKRNFLIFLAMAVVFTGCGVITKEISFYSDPEQVTVKLNNEQGIIGQTPLENVRVKFSEGTDVIVAEARKEKFLPATQNIYRTTKEVNFYLEVEKKKIDIYSNVRNTEIYLDSEKQGTCGPSNPYPLVVDLADRKGAPKSYLLKVTKIGWVPVEKKIGPGVEYIPSEIKFQLEPERKKIIIDSSPQGADVYMDGQLIKSKTPCEVSADFVNKETGDLKTLKIEVEKVGYENPKDHSNRVAEVLEYFPEADRKIKLEMVRRVEVEVPGLEIILMPRGAAMGIRKTRSILDPAEDSPAVASCTRITSYSPAWFDYRIYDTFLRLLFRMEKGQIAVDEQTREELRSIMPPQAGEVTENSIKELIKKYLRGIISLSISPDGKTLAYSEIEPIFLKKEEKVEIFGGEEFPERTKTIHKIERRNKLPCSLLGVPLSLKAGIRTIGVQGGGITVITDSIFIDKDPAFTPDGKYIYFSSTRDGDKFTIWRLKFEPPTGVGLTRITSTVFADDEVDVCLSQNFPKLCYSSLGPGKSVYEKQLWMSNLDGTLPTQFRYGQHPHWSPDGSKIVFSRIDDKTGWMKIWVMKSDGTDQTQLTFGDYDDIHPKFSPDGQYIVYASSAGLDKERVHNYDIWVMKADGTTPTQLTTNGSEDIYPVWSYDMKSIYFISNREGAWNIWKIDIRGLP